MSTKGRKQPPVVAQNNLGVTILSYHGNDVAAAFGLRFALPDYMVGLYKKLGDNPPSSLCLMESAVGAGHWLSGRARNGRQCPGRAPLLPLRSSGEEKD